MNKTVRNLTYLNLFIFTASYDCCFIVTKLFEKNEELRCDHQPKEIYEFESFQVGVLMLCFGLILSVITFLVRNQQKSKTVNLSLYKP